MADIDLSLETYVRNVIALSKKDVIAAAKTREWFLAKIVEEVESRVGEPSLASPPFLYYGSYFKGTKVADVDEFDVMVRIDSRTGVFRLRGEPFGHGEGTASPNHKYDPKYMREDGSGVSPIKLLNWLRDVVHKVAKSYGGEAPIRNGQAVTAHIASRDINFDLVPGGAFATIAEGREFYNIPDGSPSGGWTLTSPQEDIDRLRKVAQSRPGFRDVVRLCKRVKDTHGLGMSSFAIETAVVGYWEERGWNQRLSSNFLTTLVHLKTIAYAGVLTDPFDGRTNLLGDLDPDALVDCGRDFDRVANELMVASFIADQDVANEHVRKTLEGEL